MKQIIVMIGILVLLSCTMIPVTPTQKLVGSWVWENSDITSGNPVLLKHELKFSKDKYQEGEYQNSVSQNIQKGAWKLTQSDGNTVTFWVTGEKTKEYQGILEGNQLMITKIGGVPLSPPSLYQKQ